MEFFGILKIRIGFDDIKGCLHLVREKIEGYLIGLDIGILGAHFGGHVT